MKQKGLAPLVIIILIALGLGGYLFYQKQTKPVFVSQSSPNPVSTPANSDETANWKTYRNTKYGYYFKYPSAYKINNGVSEIKTTMDDSALVGIIDQENLNTFIIAVIVKKEFADQHAYNASDYNTFTYNIDGLLSAKIGENIKVSNGFQFNRLPDEKIGGKTAKVFENTDNKKEGYFVVNTQKYIYVLGRYNGELDNFQQIFSTFKFLEDAQIVDTSTWRIYEKKEIGLSLKYPSYWEIKELNNDKYKEGNWSGIEIKGEEGEVEILWGWGFGGACPGGYEDISIKNKKLHTCHGLDQEGYEIWNQIGGVKGKQIDNFGRVGFTAKAVAYPPSQATRNTILKIISSIDLVAWE